MHAYMMLHAVHGSSCTGVDDLEDILYVVVRDVYTVCIE